MEQLYKIVYFIFWYLPLVFWLLYKTPVIKKFLNRFDLFQKQIMQVDSAKYTLKKFACITILVSLIAYVTIGAVGAVFQTLIGFKGEYSFSDLLFIFNGVKSAFEFAIFISILASIRLMDFFTLNISFAKKVLQTQKNPKRYIQDIYFKYFVIHIVYGWLFLNIYYQIFGEFLILDGATYIVLPKIFT